jgi:site-specific DNA recombinase
MEQRLRVLWREFLCVELSSKKARWRIAQTIRDCDNVQRVSAPRGAHPNRGHMTVRTYCRRSKNDEGKQQFSLDIQFNGCIELIARLGLGNEERVDYVDDGRAGDDFLTRPDLRRMLIDAKRGDVIVCRDQSRLGRDALEVTLVIRDLVRDRGCRIFYHVTGLEVQFANAIDQATTFIQGTGHQMELEAIRSRTREALRSRVRDGRIAGGSCYGFRLERKSDGSGRKYTIALVEDAEAPIVRRIYEEFLAGRGFKQIAHRLNDDGIPAPSAGRRGSGSWAPSAVRTILLNPRYRGVYLHGRIKKLRQAGAVCRVKADPREVIETEIPEWRIVEDATWFAVQERFTTRGPQAKVANRQPPRTKYALTGLARCATCGGAIISHRVRTFGGGAARVMAYGCARHRDRGNAVCPVTVYQNKAEVEAALVDQLQTYVLSEQALTMVIGQVKTEIEAQLPQRHDDIAALEAELAGVRSEQKRLAKAIALSDEVPELVVELQQRSARIQNLEAQLIAARRTPAELAALIERVERNVRYNVAKVRQALADEGDRREVFQAMFPSGLTFEPTRTPDNSRQIWMISGEADFAVITENDGSSRFRLRSDPYGIRTRVTCVKGGCPRPLDEGVSSGFYRPLRSLRRRRARILTPTWTILADRRPQPV